MKQRRRRGARGGRVIIPALIGCLVVGASFVGIALASQVEAPRRTSISEAIADISDRWLSETPSSDRPVAVVVQPAVMPRSLPTQIRIEAIGVSSPLHEVGLQESGAIETPAGALYDQAAWYKHSPTPGSLGPAVILGHVDSAANGPSVFFRLGELRRGDAISVEREDGTVARFVVDSVNHYAKDEFPTKLVYGDLDHAGLRLVTCGGEFDEVAGHYKDNVVVFATLEQGASI